MAVAIVDNAGMLVLYERMDNTQTGSVLVSQDKASSAAMFRQSQFRGGCLVAVAAIHRSRVVRRAVEQPA